MQWFFKKSWLCKIVKIQFIYWLEKVSNSKIISVLHRQFVTLSNRSSPVILICKFWREAASVKMLLELCQWDKLIFRHKQIFLNLEKLMHEENKEITKLLLVLIPLFLKQKNRKYLLVTICIKLKAMITLCVKFWQFKLEITVIIFYKKL